MPVCPIAFHEASKNSRFFEIAFVLVRFDHIARRIVNANHGIALSSEKLLARKSYLQSESGVICSPGNRVPKLGHRSISLTQGILCVSVARRRVFLFQHASAL